MTAQCWNPPRKAVGLIAACIVLIETAAANLWSDEPRMVEQVIRSMQPKMVKIYGAGAGRIEGYATGILVSGDGQILTTQGALLDGTQVSAVTSDGVSHRASVLRRDRQHQLALLKIPVPTPDFFSIDTSASAKKGDWVVALSNAFKVAEKEEPLSATLGVIALRTSIDARLNETDVAYKGELILVDQITSNPGAAGGAVVTLDGKLVGVIGKIINSTETNTRINYAIPNPILADFLAGPKTVESVVRSSTSTADLGIRLFEHGGRASPAYIDRVERGSPASVAQLEPDDLVISIAGAKIGNVREYNEAVKSLQVGQEVIIVVKRGSELLRLPIVPREKQ
jgi:serine protease Do